MIKQFPKEKKQQALNTNTKKAVRLTLFIIIFFFGGFLIWAFFAPLHSGVVSPGIVKTVSRIKVIQSPYTAKVTKIETEEGDEVKKGQILLCLDNSEAKASLSKSESNYFYLLSMEARLIAEINRSDKITFPKELMKHKDSVLVKSLIETQKELFKSKMQTLKTQRKSVLANTAGLEAQMNSYILSLRATKNRLLIVDGQIKSLTEITKEGYYPKNKFLDLQARYQNLKSVYEDLYGKINLDKKQISENREKIKNIKSQFLSEAQSKLTQTESQLAAAKYEYTAAKVRYNNSFIKSPVDGTVLSLKVHTIGAVAGEGREIMTILPKDSNFIIEAHVSPMDIAKVKEGGEAYLMFSGLSRLAPEVKGKIIYVSADIIEDSRSKREFYTVRVKLTKQAVQKLSGKKIKPGMPASVKITAGAKSLAYSILDPLLQNFFKSFRD